MPLAWPEFVAGYEQLCQAFDKEVPSTLRLEARFDEVKDLDKSQFDEVVRLCRMGNSFPTAQGWTAARVNASRRKAPSGKGVRLRPMTASGAFVRHDAEPICHGLAEWVRDRQLERLADETLPPSYFAARLAESNFADLFGWWIDAWREAGDKWPMATTFTAAQSAIRYAPDVMRANLLAERKS